MYAMQSQKYAVIIGSGMGDLFQISGEQMFQTPYGNAYLYGVKDNDNVLLLPRHGVNYSYPPHMINFRANVYALKMMNIKYAIATSAVGSLKKRFSPGSFMLLDQVIDFTKNRLSTFFDGQGGQVVFTDVTKPYSEKVRSAIVEAGKQLQIKVYPKGTYVCTEGPRYETSAEIKAYRILGADVVGMTGVPEVFLTKELGIEYASIAIATNWAAGITDRIEHHMVIEIMHSAQEKAKPLILKAIEILREREEAK